jgi:hypothetical protein
MESTQKVQGKRKKTRPPRGGRRGGQVTRRVGPIHLKSDAKRSNSAWKKSFPPSRWPTKWAWA